MCFKKMSDIFIKAVTYFLVILIYTSVLKAETVQLSLRETTYYANKPIKINVGKSRSIQLKVRIISDNPNILLFNSQSNTWIPINDYWSKLPYVEDTVILKTIDSESSYQIFSLLFKDGNNNTYQTSKFIIFNANFIEKYVNSLNNITTTPSELAVEPHSPIGLNISAEYSIKNKIISYAVFDFIVTSLGIYLLLPRLKKDNVV
jgi:hypothetical protein